MNSKVDGRVIANEILEHLKEDIDRLHLKPRLEVVLIGDDPASLSFISQKRKAAEKIGALVTLHQRSVSTSDESLQQLLDTLAHDKHVHGIIIQRPLPKKSTIHEKTLSRIPPEKDVDGFVSQSQFQVPVAKAVITILEKIYRDTNTDQYQDFYSWLRTQHICVLGKGETAGGPIIRMLESIPVSVSCIDRSTTGIRTILKKATIIISCVGKPKIITSDVIGEHAILISVGLSKINNMLVGDYEESDIQEKAGFYTPTPGGVGPINVACLMANVVEASQKLA
jgi:methylenetetrahydrofolate dehydrogenase (NADP+)/methenyltetrahydrofolate cyclohydrolase